MKNTAGELLDVSAAAEYLGISQNSEGQNCAIPGPVQEVGQPVIVSAPGARGLP